MDTAARSLQRLDPASFYRKFADGGTRPDGRAPLEPRRCAVQVGGFSSADGSASVRMGGTSVVACVTCEPAAEGGAGSGAGSDAQGRARGSRAGAGPSSSRSASSSSSSSSPLSVSLLHPEVRGGGRVQLVGNSARGQEVVAFLLEVLGSPGVLDGASLAGRYGAGAGAGASGSGAVEASAAGAAVVVVPFSLTIDLVCTTFDGNLLDAALLAAVAAVKATRFPATLPSAAAVGAPPLALLPAGPAGPVFVRDPVPLTCTRIQGGGLVADPSASNGEDAGVGGGGGGGGAGGGGLSLTRGIVRGQVTVVVGRTAASGGAAEAAAAAAGSSRAAAAAAAMGDGWDVLGIHLRGGGGGGVGGGSSSAFSQDQLTAAVEAAKARAAAMAKA
jgi:hypothetical protein